MPTPRALCILVFALVAVACAPGPELADAVPTPSTAATTTTIPRTTTTSGIPSLDRIPPDVSELPLDPDNLATVAGRIVVQSSEIRIRFGDTDAVAETGDVPNQPTWSRDGSRLVSRSFNGRDTQIDVVDRNGATIATSPGERPYFFFSWSYDGSRIAALGPGETGTTLDILDADGALIASNVANALSLYVAWDPAQNRMVAHADDRLLRIDAAADNSGDDSSATATDLGAVGVGFITPKWIPFSNEVLLVIDIEGTPTLIRRGIEGGDTLTTLGAVEGQLQISVNPDGHRAALARVGEATDAGGAGSQVRFGPGLAQSTGGRAGDVQIVDLLTGERSTVFALPIEWAEWNPQGDKLLMSVTNFETGGSSWWIYEADVTPDLETDPVTFMVTSFISTPTFFDSYLQFADQFIEQPRLWSPAGTAFVYSDLTVDGGVVRLVPAIEAGLPSDVARGEVGFWSPSP